MKILLPPSEGKTPPAPDQASAPLSLEALTLPELASARDTVVDELARVSLAEDAQQVLKVGAKVMPEVLANAALREAPTAPAHQIYTGVLFDALDSATLTEEELARASGDVLIFSGLFGATGFTDRIPAYRLSMDVRLPELGGLGTYWKRHLAEPLAALCGEELVVDCRSSSYGKAFVPDPQRTLMVNSFTERDGARKVVTHFAKHARGELTGMLLRAETPAETIQDVVEIASRRWTVEVRPAEGRRPHQLDLISAG